MAGGEDMAETLEELQRRICKAYGADYTPPDPGSRVGIALATLGGTPIQGVRHRPTETTCGWYIYAGREWSDDANFYQPLCVEHMAEYSKFALPFLALPPGWCFYTDGNGNYGASFDKEFLQDSL
jgi:hypothetical protein